MGTLLHQERYCVYFTISNDVIPGEYKLQMISKYYTTEYTEMILFSLNFQNNYHHLPASSNNCQ